MSIRSDTLARMDVRALTETVQARRSTLCPSDSEYLPGDPSFSDALY